jgi:hypothetical protein
MIPTPRTDAFEKTIKSWCGDEALCLEFARQLERELFAEYKGHTYWFERCEEEHQLVHELMDGRERA